MITGRNSARLLGIVVSIVLLTPLLGVAEEKSLSLEQAIHDALLSNLSLKLERERHNEAIGVAQSSEGIFDTTFKAGAQRAKNENTAIVPGSAEEENTTNWSTSLSKTFTPGTELSLSWDNNEYESSPSTSLYDPVYSTGVNLTVSQPLLKGFGSENQTTTIRTAQKLQEIRALVVENRVADLAAEVKKSYWDLVFAWQDIEVRRLTLKLAEKLLEETKDKINAGKLANVELFRPQSVVARREEGLISAERVIGLAEDQIKILLNIDDWSISIRPTDRPNTEEKNYTVQSILENTMKNRPDLKAAILSKDAAAIAQINAKDQTRPSLALIGSVGLGGTDESFGDSLDDLSSDSETSWKIGLAFSRPIFNTAAKGEVMRAEAALNQAETSHQILQQDIQRAVRAALRDVTLAIKAMEATRKSSLATLKGLEAEQIKFDAGRGTTLDVLVAQETYATSLSQENLAKINYAKTLAELDRIQGIVTAPTP